jgi:hypothetical protein
MTSDTAEHEEAAFREVQSFRQWWVWLLVIATAGFTWYAAIYQLLGRKPLGGDPAPDWLILFLWLFIGMGVPALLLTATLRVEVWEDALYFRYYPFHRRVHRITYDEVKKVEARTYRPIVEYGGWGIRGGWGKAGKAYNVYGNKGVQFELTDGKRVLFGSQKADEFAAAVREAMRGRGEQPA